MQVVKAGGKLGVPVVVIGLWLLLNSHLGWPIPTILAVLAWPVSVVHLWYEIVAGKTLMTWLNISDVVVIVTMMIWLLVAIALPS